VDTPVLQPLYGGAFARPFVTRHEALDTDLYLRISNELYLKRLIVGGFERVYEIARDFRNEGIDRSHNPEFSMLEFYEAYADLGDMMDLTETLVARAVAESVGDARTTYGDHTLDFTPPWRRVRYFEALAERATRRTVWAWTERGSSVRPRSWTPSSRRPCSPGSSSPPS
jgi:lysyl-tRNA synthetase class 2